jgi:hypothetical protein
VNRVSKLSLAALAVCVGANIFVSSAVAADRDAAERPTDVVKLFDGTSLDGFYTWLKSTKYEDPKQIFRVTDGMLHVTGDGLGAVITKKEYRDYHCVLEFKWGPRTWQHRTDRTKDSGLLVHSVGADGAYGGTWMPSMEAQIIEGGMGDFILVGGNDKEGNPVPLSLTCETDRDRDGEVIWKAGGKRETFDLDNRARINWWGRDPDWEDVLGFRGEHDVDSPDGEWTRMEVVCDGGHIQIFVNGVKVNEGFDSYPSYGRLQLQTEMAELFVRRWELWPLDSAPKPAAAVQ